MTTMCKLNWEETRIKRQIKFRKIRIKFQDIIGFGILSKISVNPKDNYFTVTELHRRYFTFERLFMMAASEVIVLDKYMFKVDIKVTNTASGNVILLFLV